VNRGVAIVLDEPKHPVSVALRAFADQYIITPPASSLPAARDADEPATQASGSAQQSPQSWREARLFRRGVK
jgi:pilus assembly protein CpaE